MMSYRTLPPISGTYHSSIAVSSTERSWTAPLKGWQHVRFSEPWSTYDCGITGTGSQPQWNRIAGFALAAVISVGGWSGIALLINYLWK